MHVYFFMCSGEDIESGRVAVDQYLKEYFRTKALKVSVGGYIPAQAEEVLGPDRPQISRCGVERNAIGPRLNPSDRVQSLVYRSCQHSQRPTY